FTPYYSTVHFTARRLSVAPPFAAEIKSRTVSDIHASRPDFAQSLNVKFATPFKPKLATPCCCSRFVSLNAIANSFAYSYTASSGIVYRAYLVVSLRLATLIIRNFFASSLSDQSSESIQLSAIYASASVIFTAILSPPVILRRLSAY